MNEKTLKKQGNHKYKTLSLDAFSNEQLALFQSFLTTVDTLKEDLSNAIDLWDNIPRYSISRKKQEKLRLSGGFLPISTLEFKYRNHEMKIHIRPARIEVTRNGKRTGETIEYYPSAREEIIEHALRKLAVEKEVGFFDSRNLRSGCHFTLYQLRKHLMDVGHSLRYDEVIEGLTILSLSSLEIEGISGNHEITYTHVNYLSLLARVRSKDRVTDTNARWLVQFHPLITANIQTITYRQFNYKRLMNCRTQLSRWLITQLVLKYTQASMLTSFDIRYSTIERDSGLLGNYNRNRDAVAALHAALEEIKSLGILNDYKKSEQRGIRGKLEDIVYTLHPSSVFVYEQKAANRRRINGQEKVKSPATTLK